MKNLTVALFLLACRLSFAQTTTTDTLAVHSIEGIVNQGFEMLSNINGDISNLDRMRELYLPDARFTILYHPNDSFPVAYESVSLNEFFEYMKEEHEYYEKGFVQYEIGKVVNEYNGIANVFQSFYAKDSDNEEARGISSYQLIYFDDRWWISDVLWTANTNGVKIPEKYLTNQKDNATKPTR